MLCTFTGWRHLRRIQNFVTNSFAKNDQNAVKVSERFFLCSANKNIFKKQGWNFGLTFPISNSVCVFIISINETSLVTHEIPQAV